MTMDKQLDATAINLDQDALRDLLDCEIMLVGGGDIVQNGY